MRIGVNALYLLPGKVGGTEIYLRCLLKEVSRTRGHSFEVFVNRETDEAPLAFEGPSMTVVSTGVVGANRPARILFEQVRLARLCRQRHVDVLFNPGFSGPLRPVTPMVSVVHDLQFREHPEFFSRKDRLAWRFFVGGSIRRADRIICISEATKQRLQTFYDVAGRNIDVVPHGIDESVLALRWNPREHYRYLLTISTLHPHKNLDTLLRAFQKFHASSPEYRLVIVGLAGHATQQLLNLRRELALEDSVEFTFWVERDRVMELLAGAWAFVFPSRYEGFGMPVAEALSIGIPTACADIPALREVAGDAALFFPPQSVEELVRVLDTITSNSGMRPSLSAKGPPQTQQFRWERTASATIASLERAVQESTISRKA